MDIRVGEICGSTDAEHFSFIFIDGFKDARVEDWSFSPGVDTDKQNHISIFDHFDLRIEQVVGTEIVWQGEVASFSELIIKAVEGVKEVLEGLNILDTLKLADSAGYIFSLDLVDPSCDHCQSILPSLF